MREKFERPLPVAGLVSTTRRGLLGGAIATGAATFAGGASVAAQSAVFRHGVASGDPQATSVILWTRISGATRSTSVTWSVALDEGMTQIVRRGSFVTTGARDYTVKPLVTGLQPGRTYYYCFSAMGMRSPVGRTRTLPNGNVSQLKFAVFSCSNYEGGFFNAYREAAARNDLDACIHLGDYLYEYGSAGLGLGQQPRIGQLVPGNEILSLADYRTRHALYKTDPDLQEVHRKNPFITVWDDHESTNDSWTDGAENHQPATEGDWDARKARAIQAYYEWMPIAEPTQRPRIDADGNPQGLYRDFDFGSLVRLIALDTRLAGRDEQLAPDQLIGVALGARRDTLDGTAGTRTRRLLGPTQKSFVQGRVQTSTQTWQLFANQVLAHYQPTPDINGSSLPPAVKQAFIAGFSTLFPPALVQQLLALAAFGVPSPIANDAWTGYPTERAEFVELLRLASNPVIVTGDTHNAWTANIRRRTSATTTEAVAVEFGGTSVSSPGAESLVGPLAPFFEQLLIETSTNRSPTDKLIFTNQSQRGLLFVEVTPAQVTAEHVFVSTVFSNSYTTTTRRFTVNAGARTAVPA